MLRQQRHFWSLPWICCGVGFTVGVLLTYILLANKPGPEETWSPHRKQRFILEDGKSSADKKKLLAIVGVQTGFARLGTPNAYNYKERRDALRKTWFPATPQDADRLEQETGILFRFVIGHNSDPRLENAVNREMERHGNCIRLPVKEDYLSLTRKTLVFLQYVNDHYEADYIVKVDDDVYLRRDRLPTVIAQWKEGRAGLAHADYVGCMKTGGVFRDPNLRWFEPQHSLIGGSSYFTHAWGSIYVMSGRAASLLATLSAAAPEGLRFFNNEDVTVGGWMLAMNVTHLDDRRLCEPDCGPATVAVYDIPQCAGLCDAPHALPQLHSDPACNTPVLDETGDLPTLQPFFWFHSISGAGS